MSVIHLWPGVYLWNVSLIFLLKKGSAWYKGCQSKMLQFHIVPNNYFTLETQDNGLSSSTTVPSQRPELTSANAERPRCQAPARHQQEQQTSASCSLWAFPPVSELEEASKSPRCSVGLHNPSSMADGYPLYFNRPFFSPLIARSYRCHSLHLCLAARSLSSSPFLHITS